MFAFCYMFMEVIWKRIARYMIYVLLVHPTAKQEVIIFKCRLRQVKV